MTKLSNFFVNPFNEKHNEIKQAAKAETSNRLTETAHEIFKDKPFALENKTTFVISNIIKYVANIVSFATAFFALRFVLSLTVGLLVASLGALLLCGLIEYLKNNLWKTNVKQLLRYKKPSFLGFTILVLLSVLSIAFSVYGAYLIPSEISQPQPVSYSKNDSLVLNELTLVNTQLSNLDRLLLETSAKATPDQSGKISGTFKALLKKQTAQKDSLNAQKRGLNAMLQEISINTQRREKDAILEHKNGTYNAQIACVIVALLFELIYTICSVYSFYYLFRVYIDSPPATVPIKQPANLTNLQPPPAQQAPPANRQKIGFFATNNQSQDNTQTQHLSGFKAVLKPFDNGLICEENGIKFVWHNGKKYTKTDVQNNINANLSKYKKYTLLQDTERAKAYCEKSQLWENYKRELEK